MDDGVTGSGRERGRDGRVRDDGQESRGREARDGAADDATRDGAAASFLAVERALESQFGTGRTWGRAVDVERVPVADVPDDYPEPIATDTALALTVAVEGDENRTDVVYFEWPGDGAAERLDRLLALLGIEPHRFADLHGAAVPLRREEGHVTANVPDEDPRGTPLGLLGVLAGTGATLLLLGPVSSGSPAWIGLLLTAAILCVLPLSTYLDAWYMRTHTDWDHGVLFWASLAMAPGINLLSSAAYLVLRWRATPLVPED